MIHKNEENDKKERALAHQKLLAELGEIKTNCLRGKDMGIDIENLDLEAELAKYKGLDPLGIYILVRLYTEPQEKEGALMDTDREHADQVYSSFLGTVLAIGADAFDTDSLEAGGSKRFPRGNTCNVGDHIIFPKSSGVYLYYNHSDGTTSPLYLITEIAPMLRVSTEQVKAIKRK